MAQLRTRGFTLIEVLVVVAIIALLIAIFVPSLQRARAKAKEIVCINNVQQLGRGFHTYAAANKDYLCSGAFDPNVDNGRDGPVDEVGWVADLVNSKAGIPAEVLCPTNPAKVNQKLAEGSSGSFGDLYTNGDDYTTWDAIDDRIRRGYNTNYTQSWYMARTEARVTGPNWWNAEQNLKRLRATYGPLRTSSMMKVAMDRVPLIGDGNVEGDDLYQGAFRHELSELTVKTMTDGPMDVFYAPQNYSDFGPQHGWGQAIKVGPSGNVSRHNRADILFADGHVDAFIDNKKVEGSDIISGRDGAITAPVKVPGGSNEYIQPDVDIGRFFDGVLSIGRRSKPTSEWKPYAIKK